MEPPGADVILCRYGEIGVKSRQVRTRMEQQLRENIAAVLGDRDHEATIHRDQGRIYVYPKSEPDAVADAVTDVFGIVSASVARRTEPTMDGICDALAATARNVYGEGSFAVRARRAGESGAHPFTSEDIEREGGAAVWNAAEERGVEPTVDLENPDLTFFVECRSDRAFVFLEKRPGPGGLPVGTQEPMVALLSGGIDSPVAAWEVLKRGVPVLPLYIDLGDYGGVDHRLRAEQATRTLQAYVPNFDLRLRVAPAGDGIDHIATETDNCRMLVLRRFMFRVAEYVADSTGAAGIVTGEAIGQKSSQTSVNLGRTAAVTDLPIHRPLLTRDKAEITDQAQAIETFEDATISAGCNRLAPDSPVTKPTLSVVRETEPDDIDAYARAAADEVTIVDL